MTGVRCAPSQGQTVKVEPHNVRNINMQSDRSGKRLEGCGWGAIRQAIEDRIGKRWVQRSSGQTNILTNYIVVHVWRVHLARSSRLIDVVVKYLN